uniref:Uncharacterized protein n=1 Tax=Sphaerodactylus townsendi TaxID=933632 RepID=A0ACB8FXV0_9SAUR
MAGDGASPHTHFRLETNGAAAGGVGAARRPPSKGGGRGSVSILSKARSQLSPVRTSISQSAKLEASDDESGGNPWERDAKEPKRVCAQLLGKAHSGLTQPLCLTLVCQDLCIPISQTILCQAGHAFASMGQPQSGREELKRMEAVKEEEFWIYTPPPFSLL